MIQRIQTVFLLLTALCGGALYYTAEDVVIGGSNLAVRLSAGIVFLLAMVSLFSYRNRSRQMRINIVNLFINALLIGVLLYWLLNLSGGISIPEKGIELAFPLIALVCLALANGYIRRDEKLVKSVDRLR